MLVRKGPGAQTHFGCRNPADVAAVDHGTDEAIVDSVPKIERYCSTIDLLLVDLRALHYLILHGATVPKNLNPATSGRRGGRSTSGERFSHYAATGDKPKKANQIL